MNFEGKSFLKLLDFTPEEISALIDLAATLKAKKKAWRTCNDVYVKRKRNIAIILKRQVLVQDVLLK